ncbi:rRNA-binding ribosome biosynthesis protein rpf2 [Quaeritorhiza haematococci]|nr:rRNA-binding ribosome biosynthesis protein rpf2 [Quaeritorhiza haematococci]
MLQKVTPRTASARRALKKREPQVVEGAKTAIFLKGTTSSETCVGALKDLYSLRKSHSIMFMKRNPVHPFDDAKPLEFLSQKNDAALFCLATHSKKRPHNLSFVRMFDYQVLDMIEFGIKDYIPLDIFENAKCAVGHRPCILFVGELFEQDELYKKLRSFFLDFFRGEPADSVNLAGIDHVLAFIADPSGDIRFRVYTVSMKKSGGKIPRVELEEMGPSMDLTVRRTVFAPDDLLREAMKIPKELKPKKEKNIDRSAIGDKIGRIHMVKQDLSKLQTRKMKGLKRQREEDSDNQDAKKLAA